MNNVGMGKSVGSEKNSLMFGDDGLEVRMQRRYLCGVNGMDLCTNAWMSFLEELFRATGTDDSRGFNDDAVELIFLALLSPTHGDKQGDDVSRPSGCRHGVPRDNLTNNVHLHIQRPTSPPHFQVHNNAIHHIKWIPEDIGSWSMRYKLGITVHVI